MKAVYRWWSALVAVGVLVQIGFAGYGAFYVADKADGDSKIVSNHAVEHGFGPHAALGTIIVVLGVLALPLAFGAKVSRERRRLSIVLAVLMVLQFVLAILGWTWAPLGFLHPLNALAIAAVAGVIARKEWRGADAPATAATPLAATD